MITTTPRLTMPTRNLVGGRHRYIPAAQTDVRKTFAKFERAMRIEQLRQQHPEPQQ